MNFEDEYAKLWQMYGDLEDQRDYLEEALRKLSTARCFGNGESLGKYLPDYPLGREILARMEYAAEAIEDSKHER